MEESLCQHLEVQEFGIYKIRDDDLGHPAALMECRACGQLLTLDNQEINESEILLRLGTTRDNLRTVVVQLSEDIYEKIQQLVGPANNRDEFSKITNELIALGLRNYRRISAIERK